MPPDSRLKQTADDISTGLRSIPSRKRLVAAIILTVLYPLQGRAQTHSAFPGIDSFTQLGVSGDPAVLDSGQAWSAGNEATPVVHRRELPVNNAVVTFP